MEIALLQFAVSYFNVLVHGVQTQNVVRGHYFQAAIVSLLMSVGQVATVGLIMVNTWDSFIPVSLGGMLGILSAMWLKRRHHA